MDSNFDLKTWLELTRKYWSSPTGLVFSLVGLTFFIVFFLNSLDSSIATRVISHCISSFSLVVVWIYSNRINKNVKGKVGFVVCIQCNDEKENEKIREDFIITVRDIVKSGNLSKYFHFIEIKQHIAKNVNDADDAYSILAKTNSHFIIYGRVRLRSINGQNCHIIDLEGVVAHKPIPFEVSDVLAREFRELFPRKIRIPTENDLLTFNFTSDWTECVAKYIIGIASALSMDIDFAEKLFLDVKRKIEYNDTNFPVYLKLKERLPARFSEIYQARAIGYLNLWRDRSDVDYLNKFIENVKKIPKKFHGSYGVLLLLCIEAFLNGRNVEKAIFYAKKCKLFYDPIWHFNLAFLYAYKKDLNNAIKQYNICSKFKIEPETISQVEDFIVWIIDDDPKNYQYYYCLGYFNWKIKGDLRQSLQDFEKFIQLNLDDIYLKEQMLACSWCNQIRNLLFENKQVELDDLSCLPRVGFEAG